MTDEELDQWRGQEARRLRRECPEEATEVIAARLAREGWTPPEPVDPDVLAFREWSDGHFRLGDFDRSLMARAYLAGARMAREQEREREKVLVDNLDNLVCRVAADWAQDDVTGINASEMISAREALAKYRGEA